ncbi:Isoaspartyl peptidase/L-asparaginase [Galemys pyrenaicus]|uniref:Isoaspartyl peptidase/L-asparaginase n=1 Tax=Galemys pyrenaicus TaxID=202257 RepID=A0A8J6AGY4_GALPY|nr:Isoaspartyl peptidase/L-asparaginase [Galemys pyrenaicus]
MSLDAVAPPHPPPGARGPGRRLLGLAGLTKDTAGLLLRSAQLLRDAPVALPDCESGVPRGNRCPMATGAVDMNPVVVVHGGGAGSISQDRIERVRQGMMRAATAGYTVLQEGGSVWTNRKGAVDLGVPWEARWERCERGPQFWHWLLFAGPQRRCCHDGANPDPEGTLRQDADGAVGRLRSRPTSCVSPG